MSVEHVAGPSGNKKLSIIGINAPNRLKTENAAAPTGARELTPYGIGIVMNDAWQRTHKETGLLDADLHGLTLQQIIDEVGLAMKNEKSTIGMNVLTPNFADTMILAQSLHAAYPHAQFVFGGPHAILDPESILQHMPDATVIQGHGEVSFARAAAGIHPGEIHGAIFIDHTRGDKVVHGGHGLPNVVGDMDEIAWVDRRFFSNEPFLKDGEKTAMFVGSVGCRGACTFCITPAEFEILRPAGAKKVQFRSIDGPHGVIAEIVQRKNDMGITLAQFIDDDFLPSTARVEQFLAAWEGAGLAGKMKFVALLRPDKIPEFEAKGLMVALKNAGLTRLSLGIETGHDYGRRLMTPPNARNIDPKYRPELVRESIQILHKHGIYTKGFFMLGLPGETRKQAQETLKFMYGLRRDGLQKVAIYPYKPYPHTELYNAALKLGFTPEQLGDYRAPNIRALIAKGYKTQDVTRDGFTISAQISGIPVDELNDICMEHTHIFNTDAPDPFRGSDPPLRRDPPPAAPARSDLPMEIPLYART